MKLKSLFILAAAVTALPAFAADIVVSGQISANTTWTASNRYLLQGKVYVVNGATLTIEPGTVVAGRVSTGNDASALVITRNAKINANGTAANPIVFTSELDQLNGNLTVRDVGLWGGVVILGNATINSRADSAVVAAPITDQIEGIVLAGGDTALGTYGGTNDDDNSGTFRYVSIRHGGAIVGTANELNGLSMGGVGRGTTIEYVEVFANRDDGFEWFGGTVNARYLVAAYCGDDLFDYDQGYRGKLQFLFGIQADNRLTDSEDGYHGDKGFEFDGATAPEATATPIGGGTIYNATLIGIGAHVRPNGAAGNANVAMHLRDNGAHKIFNSVFVDYANIFQVDADEQPRIDAGEFKFEGNAFFSHLTANNAVNATGGTGVFASGSAIRPALLTATSNFNVNPSLRAISRARDGVLDPRLSPTSVALASATGALAHVATPTDEFFITAPYRGAFSPNGNWAYSWTKLGREGYFAAASAGSTNGFVNISTRATVAASAPVFPGFVIRGDRNKTVLVRAIGPSLAQFAGIVPAADPTLELYNSANVKIAENDDVTGTQAIQLATQVGAFALLPNSKDAVIVASLPPGNYTAIVRAKTGTAVGEVIVEVYEVD